MSIIKLDTKMVFFYKCRKYNEICQILQDCIKKIKFVTKLYFFILQDKMKKLRIFLENYTIL